MAHAYWVPSGASTPVMVYVSTDVTGGGYVTGMGHYAVGSTVKATAVADSGHRFVAWYAWSDAESKYVEFSKNAKLSFKVTKTMDLMALFGEVPFVAAVPSPANAGKVTGSGYCAEGKKVTLKATANKGYVFMGWYRGDGTLVAKTASIVIDRSSKPTKDSASSTTITGITSDVTYYAVYVTAEEDAASIGATVDGFAFGAGTAGADGVVVTQFATNVMAGVYLEWPVAASALSLPTVKVSGLPSGLKFKDGVIYGAPTAASKVDSKGNVTPSKVKVTVTSAGKSKMEFVIELTVDPLPAWAVGEFSGLAETPEGRLGGASMTVTAAGKVSGKVTVNAKMEDEEAAFLCPSQYVNYTQDTKAVGISCELCEGLSGEKEVFAAVCGYVEKNFGYDFIKAATVKSGTMPDIDGCIKTRMGICQDLAAVTVCMLRVQGIHARLVIGYADKAYHAWVTANVDGEEVFYDPTAAIGAIRNVKNYTVERIY